MCAPTINKSALAKKLELLDQRDSAAGFLGHYNSRVNGKTIFGDGVRGQISKAQAGVNWCNSSKGVSILNAQAKEREVEPILHRMSAIARYQSDLLAATAQQKELVDLITRVEKEMAAIDQAEPALAAFSRDELVVMLADSSGDDTNIPVARLATERGTAEAADAELAAVLNANS
jgi:hypothetical protein